MIRVTLVVREAGGFKQDFILEFDLPEIPRTSDYISVFRPGKPDLFSEDLIVRKVWWKLEHPETRSSYAGSPKVGLMKGIFVLCDRALGPYPSDEWSSSIEDAREKGIDIENFEILAPRIRESDLKPK